MTQTTDQLFELGREVPTSIQALCEGSPPYRPGGPRPSEPFVIPREEEAGHVHS